MKSVKGIVIGLDYRRELVLPPTVADLIVKHGVIIEHIGYGDEAQYFFASMGTMNMRVVDIVAHDDKAAAKIAAGEEAE